MTARYVIARGNIADEGFANLGVVARRLLQLVDEAGHGERVPCLRHGNAARRQSPAGPCLVLSILDEDGGWLEHGFAYVFFNPTLPGDAHALLEAAMRDARPETFKPARLIPWPKKDQAA